MESLTNISDSAISDMTNIYNQLIASKQEFDNRFNNLDSEISSKVADNLTENNQTISNLLTNILGTYYTVESLEWEDSLNKNNIDERIT